MAVYCAVERCANPPCREGVDPPPDEDPPRDGIAPPPPLCGAGAISGAAPPSALAGVLLLTDALAAFLVPVSVWPKIFVIALLSGFPAAVPTVAPDAAAACSARLCASAPETNKKLPSNAIGASERMDFSLYLNRKGGWSFAPAAKGLSTAGEKVLARW